MNTYKAYYNGCTTHLQADTSYEAQCKAALYFRVGRRTWLVTVMLVAKDGEPVIHSTASI